MKINKIMQICKQDRQIYLMQGKSGTQWLGNGFSLYPLDNAPTFDEESLYTTYDINEKQREKIYYHQAELPNHYNFSDNEENEVLLNRRGISINYQGKCVIPYYTECGIVFMDEKYLLPLSDVFGELEIYQRTDTNGNIYFAAKVGYVLQAIIMPITIIDEIFIEQIETLYTQSKTAFGNMKIKEVSEHQYGLYDGDDDDE